MTRTNREMVQIFFRSRHSFLLRSRSGCSSSALLFFLASCSSALSVPKSSSFSPSFPSYFLDQGTGRKKAASSECGRVPCPRWSVHGRWSSSSLADPHQCGRLRRIKSHDVLPLVRSAAARKKIVRHHQHGEFGDGRNDGCRCRSR
ncbi:unnamed protein product [Musa acuminata subsp. burmannicoides]